VRADLRGAGTASATTPRESGFARDSLARSTMTGGIPRRACRPRERVGRDVRTSASGAAGRDRRPGASRRRTGDRRGWCGGAGPVRHGAVPFIEVVEIGIVDLHVLIDEFVTEGDPQRFEVARAL